MEMDGIGPVLVVVGMLLSIIGSLWFLVVAFSEGGILWGLGCIFIPFVFLIFLIVYFGDAAKPFALSVLGSLLCIGGLMMQPGALPT